MMMWAVGLVLLSACANIAGLLLARNASRRKELAIRASIGASRGRILRQMLTESLLLSAIGGALGIAVSWIGLRVLFDFLETGPFRGARFDPHLDSRFLAFVALASLVTAVIFGVLPALQSTDVPLVPALKETSDAAFEGSGRRRFMTLGRILVMAQVAASVLLVIVGTLLTRTLLNLQHVDPGFNPDRLLLFSLDPGSSGYSNPDSQALFRRLRSGLQTLPGVEKVTYHLGTLLSGGVIRSSFDLPDGSGRSVEVDVMNVGPEFFETMQIPILAGRGFIDEDLLRRPTPAVVNQAFVRDFLGLSAQIGELRPDSYSASAAGHAIVGVAGPVRVATVRAGVRPTMFLPLTSSPFSTTFAVRTAGVPEAMVPAVRRLVAAADPTLPVLDLRTEQQVIARQLFTERLVARVAILFAAAAIGLVAIGLYGMLAFAVARRRREIGIRLALGAQPGHVQRMIVADGLRLVAAGTIAGIPAAIVVARLIRSAMYGVDAIDPASMTVGLFFVLATALAAAFVPARRAAMIEPLEAVREEM
jgi:predicted permease